MIRRGAKVSNLRLMDLSSFSRIALAQALRGQADGISKLKLMGLSSEDLGPPNSSDFRWPEL